MSAPPEHHAEPAPASQAPAVIHLPHSPPPAPAKKQPKRQRQRFVGVRLDDAEFAELERRARQAGLSVGAYCRERTLGSAGPRAKREQPTADTKLLARNMAELNRVGVNLNQMARALNEIALNEGTGRLAQVAHIVRPIQEALAALRGTLTVNCRALGYDSEG
jgi:hypothetical protein